MKWVILLAAVAAITGCAAETSSERDEAPSTARREAPPWLDGRFRDGTIEFRYPQQWKRSSSNTFGELVTDNVSPHPAFVSVRYFEADALGRDPAAFVARTIRPPAGQGLTLLYTQTALLDRRRGVEGAFVWATRDTTPVGPTMRTFLVPLRDGRAALLVLAAERPRFHGGAFRWVRETLRWTVAPTAPFRRPSGRIPNEY